MYTVRLKLIGGVRLTNVVAMEMSLTSVLLSELFPLSHVGVIEEFLRDVF